ncbi:ABC transporter substrate-binding protein [Ampullimonas aquatilis]|uniref:ABC transporter substrate-binding protein n=1 Tax=Ampullimonas aquatilis TaxID=1341549 RepID=UPI003C730498
MPTNTTRRAVLKKGIAAAVTSIPSLGYSLTKSLSQDSFKIGYISPQTGPLSAFAEPDSFTLEQIKKITTKGIISGGKKYTVEIIYKDSQSNAFRAGAIASDLILNEKVDLILASSTPVTTNPVADQCELYGVPCITNDTPWQPYFFGRHGNPKRGFKWTYHYFWGLEDIVSTFTNLWTQIPTNKMIGTLWPNDDDGIAWGDARLGFPAVLSSKGFNIIDKGRFQIPNIDFSSFITEFRKTGVDIITGVIPPSVFTNFWNQSAQQSFHPKIVTVAKATEFPTAIAAFGDRAIGLTVELMWSPGHPFNSSLTGQTSRQLADEYMAATGRPWMVTLGFKHSLFEVAIDSLKRAGGKNPEAIRDAISNTQLNTVVGPINFKVGPVPNVAKTLLVTGQWQRRGKNIDLVIVENSQALLIPKQAELEVIKYN